MHLLELSSSIKNIKGCECCAARGVSVNGHTTFCTSQSYDAERRCNDKFVNQGYAGSHQLGTTPAVFLAFMEVSKALQQQYTDWITWIEHG